MHGKRSCSRTGRSHGTACGRWSRGPCGESPRHTPMMNGHGKSDSSVVPQKSPNKAGHGAAAEEAEGRGLAKGNPRQQNAPRTQSRSGAHSALERVREEAAKDRKEQSTALLHHIYDV